MSDYPSPRIAWTVVAILLLLAMLSYTDRYVLGLLVDPVRRDLGINNFQMGLLLGTAFAIVYGLLGVVSGLVADRNNRRMLILFGVLLWSVATIGCGLAPSFEAMFVARMVVGVGEAILTPAAISMIGDYFPPARRGAAVGVYMMAVPLGSGIAAIVGGVVLKMIDQGTLGGVVEFAGAPWRAVLVILGAPGLVLAWLMLAVAEPRRRSDEQVDGGETSAASLRMWLGLAPILIGSAAMALAVGCLIAWGPSVLIGGFGLAPGDAGLAVGLSFAIGGTGGVVLGGVIGDRARTRWGRNARVRICAIGAACAIPCTLFGLAETVAVALLGMGLFIMFADWTISCAIAAILDRVPNGSRGLATSMAFFLNVTVGAGIGPLLVAMISDRDDNHDMGISIFMVALPVVGCALLAFVLASGWGQRRRAKSV